MTFLMNPELEYIRRVLGVDHVILTSLKLPEIKHRIAVVFKKSWSEKERELAIKMVKAADFDHEVVFEDTEIVPGRSRVIVDSEDDPGRVEAGQQVTWNLGPLKNMLSGTDAEMQAQKRRVWNLLKNIRSEI